jgi:hypothetical protein
MGYELTKYPIKGASMDITYNSNIDTFEKEISDNEIICFKSVLLPSIEDDNTIHFVNHNEFIHFLKNENIKSVFLTSFPVTIDDYYITEDIVEENFGEYSSANLSSSVLKAIDKYNDYIEQYAEQLKGLRNNYYFIAYNGFILLIHLSDTVSLPTPDEQLQKILVDTQDDAQKEKEEHQQLIETLKEKLKQKILADPNFHKATNKSLRREYIYKMLSKQGSEYEPLKKHWLKPWSSNTYAGAWNYVDLIWKEYKDN